MNSFQAIRDAKRRDGFIQIEMERDAILLEEEQGKIRAFTITDNGIGLNDANFDSFNTAFSDHKLARGGKGLGRFTWLKAFDRVAIDSTFIEPGEEAQRRRFIFDEDYELETEGLPEPSPGRPTGTAVGLIGFREPYKGTCPRTAEQIVQKLIEHFLLVFLEDDCPRVTVIDQGLVTSVNEVFDKEFRATAAAHEFEIKGMPFTLNGFRLTTPKLSKHKLVYSANQRGVVSDKLEQYLPNLSTRLIDRDGNSFVYLGIVQSPYLTQHVNPARTDFDFASGDDGEVDQASLFDDEIKRAEIREESLKCIEADLREAIQSINEVKEEKLRNYVKSDAPQYKILMKYTPEFIDKISPNASKSEMETALHRELYQREVKMKAEGSRIIREAEKVDDYETYQQRLSAFMEDYNELGTSALAQYIMHRRIILDFLDRAISLGDGDKKYPLEKVVHQLVFPMRSTSEETAYSEQNLWMIDERLTYHTFISSDKQLRSLEMFESDSQKRPDLFIYDKKLIYGEGDQPINSITILEFKRPDRDDYTQDENPVIQSFELVEAIRNGEFKNEKGRKISVANDKIPALIYIISDITPTLKKVLKTVDAILTPDNQGFYGFNKTYQAYYEVIDYNKLLSDAKKRNRIFFDKLNLLMTNT
ncbi:hypothetical protein [Bradyrhizobium sp. SZCCHNRI3018]|nr:hypothetical protein [Bradyrhizobium sp. SZCCHNRI3018]